MCLRRFAVVVIGQAWPIGFDRSYMADRVDFTSASDDPVLGHGGEVVLTGLLLEAHAVAGQVGFGYGEEQGQAESASEQVHGCSGSV